VRQFKRITRAIVERHEEDELITRSNLITKALLNFAEFFWWSIIKKLWNEIDHFIKVNQVKDVSLICDDVNPISRIRGQH